MTEEPTVKSWYQERYPLHPCGVCGLEHVRIPNIVSTLKAQGAPVQITWRPFEIVGTINGPVRPGSRAPQIDTPAYAYVLFWGPPGAQEPSTHTIVNMN